MPRLIVFRPLVKRQIHRLELYLADRFYPVNAAKFVDRLVDACEALDEMPERGTLRPEFGRDVRVMGFERRVTVYFRVTEKAVFILGISYGGRVPGKFR